MQPDPNPTGAAIKPKPPPLTFQQSLSRMILGQFIATLIAAATLAITILLYRRFQEVPDLAQAIVSGIQVLWYAGNIYLLASLQPPLGAAGYVGEKGTGVWKLRVVGVSDGLFGMSGGVFSILSGVEHIKGTARPQVGLDNVLLIFQVVNALASFAVSGAARKLEKDLLPGRDDVDDEGAPAQQGGVVGTGTGGEQAVQVGKDVV